MDVTKYIKKYNVSASHYQQRLSMSFNKFITLLCAIGCTYQIVDISITYFSYDTTSDLLILTPIEANIPAFTICVDLVKELKKNPMQLNNHSTTYAEIARHLNVFNDVQSDIYYSYRLVHREIYFKNNFQCLKIFSDMEGYIAGKTRPFFCKPFALGFENSNYVLSLQRPHDYQVPDRLDQSFYMTSHQILNRAKFTSDFAVATRNLLPYPFPTNCFDYSEINSSRHLCLVACQSRLHNQTLTTSL